MKILLFGKNGQVGWELNRSLQPLGEVVALGRDEADFSNPDSLRTIVQNVSPDVIVNAAAYTAVDKAEDEEDLATVINGVAPGVLAEEALKRNALLIHYSTDYVFDGTKNDPYVETDEPKPVNVYGRSKLAGEYAITKVGGDYLIFRTTWVYAARGKNFLKTMLHLAREREELQIIADQYGVPTWARNIADATAQVIPRAQKERHNMLFNAGIFNLTALGETTWHGFATAIIDTARIMLPKEEIKTRHILSIATAEYPSPARRPQNSLLAMDALQERFDVTMPSWDEAMRLCLANLLER